MTRHKEYWEQLKKAFSTNETIENMFSLTPSAPDKYYCNISWENSKEHLVLRRSPDKAKDTISVGIYFEDHVKSEENIKKFEERKNEIESAYSIELEYGRTNKGQGKAYEIKYKRKAPDIDNSENWPEHIRWMEEYSIILKTVYDQVIKGQAITAQGRSGREAALKDAEETVLPCSRIDEDIYPETAGITEGCYEGAVMQVKVNRYERSPEAREKCIERYGAYCQVCGFDFEAAYGAIGKGFIHVHHRVPISEIGAEYEVNYEKDLIPVCPNCHAMLHRKIDGHTLSASELTKIVDKRKS